MPKKQDTSWNAVAGWYDELLKGEGTYQQEVVLPNLMRRVNPAPGMWIADIACGQGYFAHAFAQAGATVRGVDLAKNLIARAIQRTPPDLSDRVTFTVSPADDLSSIPNHAVDQATIVLAIQNIEQVKGVFQECTRILVPGGSLHIVLNHPAFRVPKASEWGWDEARNIQYRRVDAYLSEQRTQIQMHPGARPEEMTVSFHRPLQYYMKLLAKAGFCLTGLEEWVSHKTSDSGPRAKAENRARSEFPLFLYLEARIGL